MSCCAYAFLYDTGSKPIHVGQVLMPVFLPALGRRAVREVKTAYFAKGGAHLRFAAARALALAEGKD
jgi:hypothetical protein